MLCSKSGLVLETAVDSQPEPAGPSRMKQINAQYVGPYSQLLSVHRCPLATYQFAAGFRLELYFQPVLPLPSGRWRREADDVSGKAHVPDRIEDLVHHLRVDSGWVKCLTACQFAHAPKPDHGKCGNTLPGVGCPCKRVENIFVEIQHDRINRNPKRVRLVRYVLCRGCRRSVTNPHPRRVRIRPLRPALRD